MKHSRSGEYKLAGGLYRLAGNLALRMLPCVPFPARDAFVRSHANYQVFDDTEIGDLQGASIRKWEAMKMPSDLSGKSVLDIGCSEGFFSQACAKRGAAQVLGVDAGLGRLVYASSIALKEGFNIHYRMGVFPDLGVGGTFDYVLCLSVLHHSLAKKDVWKVLRMKEFASELAILRKHLKRLRALTADKGTCILEMPYEYDDPTEERKVVDFEVLNEELKAAGFESCRCLGTWDYNPEHRAFKDRIIYVAEA